MNPYNLDIKHVVLKDKIPKSSIRKSVFTNISDINTSLHDKCINKNKLVCCKRKTLMTTVKKTFVEEMSIKFQRTSKNL